MPEFRFRRKKQQNRRKTVHDPEEAAKQVSAAKQLVKPDKQSKRNSISLGADLGKPDGQEQQHDSSPISRVDPKRSSLVQEREKFFELLKTKYPEQASNLEILTNGDGDDEMVCAYVCLCVCVCACVCVLLFVSVFVFVMVYWSWCSRVSSCIRCDDV